MDRIKTIKKKIIFRKNNNNNTQRSRIRKKAHAIYQTDDIPNLLPLDKVRRLIASIAHSANAVVGTM